MNRIVRAVLILFFALPLVAQQQPQQRVPGSGKKKATAQSVAANPQVKSAAAPTGPWIPCPGDDGKPVVMPVIPEIAAQNGVLRGNVLLTDSQERIAFRVPPALGNVPGGM